MEGASEAHLVQPSPHARSARAGWPGLLGFEYLWARRLHRLSEKPVLAHDHPHCTSFFIMLKRNFLSFNLCPPPLILSLGTTVKSLAPSLLSPLFSYLYVLTRSLWASSSWGSHLLLTQLVSSLSICWTSWDCCQTISPVHQNLAFKTWHYILL